MNTSSTAYLTLIAALAALSLAPCTRAETAGGDIVRFHKGDTLTLHGIDYQATRDGVAYSTLSSEYQSVAVLSGRLKSGHASAGSGDVLLTSIEGGETQALMFDAEVLSHSMAPAYAAEAGPLLVPIARRQAHRRFLGLIEPVPVNAQSPAPPAAEALRRRYLSPDVIVGLRRQAAGDPVKLNDLTAHRFVTALAAGDTASVAALIDPQPFSAASADPEVWQKARFDFATQLVATPGLSASLADAPLVIESRITWKVGSSFRLRLVNRDRAFFVSGLEPLQ